MRPAPEFTTRRAIPSRQEGGREGTLMERREGGPEEERNVYKEKWERIAMD